MAQRVTVEVECDAPGKHSGAVRTVGLGIDGVTYEIDLCAAHVKPVDEVLTMVVQGGRRVSAVRAATRAAAKPRSTSREESAAVRAWAAESGLKVSERGRISADVLEAYKNRHKVTFSAA
jgi:hypothetical protein